MMHATSVPPYISSAPTPEQASVTASSNQNMNEVASTTSHSQLTLQPQQQQLMPPSYLDHSNPVSESECDTEGERLMASKSSGISSWIPWSNGSVNYSLVQPNGANDGNCSYSKFRRRKSLGNLSPSKLQASFFSSPSACVCWTIAALFLLACVLFISTAPSKFTLIVADPNSDSTSSHSSHPMQQIELSVTKFTSESDDDVDEPLSKFKRSRNNHNHKAPASPSVTSSMSEAPSSFISAPTSISPPPAPFTSLWSSLSPRDPSNTIVFPQVPPSPPVLQPSPSYYDPVITPFLQNYLAQHSYAALQADTSENLCARTWATTGCCNANYGSTIFRLIASMKLAIMTNRTFVVTADDYTLPYLLDFPFATTEQVRKLLTHRKCPLNFNSADWRAPSDTFDELHHQELFATLSKNPWIYSKDNNVACEGYDIHTTMANANLPPNKRIMIKSGTNIPINLATYNLRCLPIQDLMEKPILRIHVGDEFEFVNTLEYNPYFLTDSRVRKIYPPEMFNNSISAHMFDMFIRPVAGIRRIVQELTRGQPFHYYIHLRGTVRKEAAEWDRKPAVKTASLALMDLLQNEQHPVWQSDPQVWDKAAYSANFAQVPNRVVLNEAGARSPPQPIRVYVSSAYTPARDVCQETFDALKVLIQKSNSTRTYNPYIECVWFSARSHQQVMGMDSNLLYNEDMEKNAKYDWGVEPFWAALVNLFVAQQTSDDIFTLTYSRFGRMLGVAANLKISGHVEETRYKKDRMQYVRMWPF